MDALVLGVDGPLGLLGPSFDFRSSCSFLCFSRATDPWGVSFPPKATTNRLSEESHTPLSCTLSCRPTEQFAVNLLRGRVVPLGVVVLALFGVLMLDLL